jgi:hypothetical protein
MVVPSYVAFGAGWGGGVTSKFFHVNLQFVDPSIFLPDLELMRPLRLGFSPIYPGSTYVSDKIKHMFEETNINHQQNY